MFKKITALFLVMNMILCLSACGNEDVSGELTASSVSTTQTEVGTTTANPENSTSTSLTQSTNSQIADRSTTTSKPTTGSPTKTSHIHSYSNANCTSPQTCSCGATVGKALGHNFSNATCTSPKICSRCGTTSGSALGHNYEPATCFLPKTCSRCKNTEGVALQHNYANGKCSLCNKIDPDWQISLSAMDVFEKSEYTSTKKKDVYDTYGNYYDQCITMYAGDKGDIWQTSSYATYHLSGKYNKFSGTIAFMQDSSYLGGELIFNVYADDKLIYSKQDITKATKPFNFSVDVKNCEFLKIQTRPDNSGSGRLILANAEVKK